MFKQIKEAVFGKRTVNGVIGNLQKTLTQLDSVKTEQEIAAQRHHEQAIAQATAASAAAKEAVRAGKVAANINNLLNAD